MVKRITRWLNCFVEERLRESPTRKSTLRSMAGLYLARRKKRLSKMDERKVFKAVQDANSEFIVPCVVIHYGAF